jgi:hypothetical protein
VGEPETARIDTYLELGGKRTFAGAIDWPGWCRPGRDETSALHGLFEYAPRYAAVLAASGLEFNAPAEPADLRIVERLPGDATTDFGAPGTPPSGDERPLNDADFTRLSALLEACWSAFDRAVELAEGIELRKGPRGGGRELAGIVEHVVDAEAGYLSRLGWSAPARDPDDPRRFQALERAAVLDAFAAAASGSLPRRDRVVAHAGRPATSSGASPGTPWTMLGRSKTARPRDASSRATGGWLR